MHVTHPLKPIWNKASEILILGSMPSIKSREQHFYYANPVNRFWKILENLFDVKLKETEEKEDFLINNHIALWDVIKSCDISSSSDASIKNIKLNDIDYIIKNSSIKVIFCTGKKSYNTLIKNYKTQLHIIYLSSPSSANASKNINDLINEYKIILEYLKK
jgi:hypoxanthine-DNA glycosylase